jgi:hypothetical protein
LEFEWDEAKRLSNIQKHGVDLLYAAGIFENITLTKKDDRHDYGEPRWMSLGMVEGECFVLVHTERQGVTRLISAWKGGRDERKQYKEALSRRHKTPEG